MQEFDIGQLERTARQFLSNLDKRNQVVRAGKKADPFKVVFPYNTAGGAPITFPSIGLPQSCTLTAATVVVGPDGSASSAAYTIYFASETDYPTGTAMHSPGDGPTLVADVRVDTDITNWLNKSFPAETRIWATLDTFTGSTENLTLELKFRKAPVRIGP